MQTVFSLSRISQLQLKKIFSKKKKKSTEHPNTMKVMKHSWYIKHMDELLQSNTHYSEAKSFSASDALPHMNPF